MDIPNVNMLLQRTAELEQELAAKNRELQLEAALERVRARTMAMQKSEELADVAELLFKQVAELDIKTWTTGFNIWSDDNNFYTDYITNPQGGFMEPYTIDATLMPVSIELRNARLRGEGFLVNHEEGEALAETYRQLGKFGENQFKGILESGFQFPTSQYEHFVFGSKVSLMFITYEPVPEAHDIFKRFGRVFEQTYTRFLDLQKAEMQAREAQIQLALERVRAKALAMQTSDDLIDVANVLREQMGKLGQPELESSIVHLYNGDSETFNVWYAYAALHQSSGIITGFTTVPKDVSEWTREVIAKYQSPEIEYTIVSSGQKLKEWYKMLEIYAPNTIEYDDQGQMIVPVILYYHFSKFFGGALLMISNQQPSQESREMQKRAAAVFGLAYTRFLDLKQAEAQAREAQIQLALERVRSRAMAMQKSDELAEAAKLLYNELRTLNINSISCGYMFINEEQQTQTAWVTLPDGTLLPDYIVFPLTGDPILDDRYRGWRHKEPLHKAIIEGDVNKEHHRFLSSQVPANFSRDIFEHIPENIVFYSANFSAGYLMIIATETLSADDEQTIIRFAKVFEITYTRFLDLQRAENQAREATIEAALERVRSRSMAMHKSDEVMDVAVTVYEQLQKLDFKFGAATIIIMDEKTGNMEHWLAGFIQKNHVESYQVNNSEHPLHAAQLAAWRGGAKFVSLELSGPALKSYAAEMFTQTGYKNLPDEEKAMLSAQEHAVFNLAYMKHGALMWAPTAISDENAVILQRFAKVFEQTYTRFLDLQKAEAQAREATIEAAMEKLRSRAMAMQTSGELNSLIRTMYTELKRLDESLNRCIIMIFDEQTKGVTWWMAGNDDVPVEHEYYVPYSEHLPQQAYLKGWEVRQEKWQYIIEGTEKKAWDEYLFTGTELTKLPGIVIQNMRSFEKIYLCASFSNFGCLTTGSIQPLSDESFSILLRFAKVFDLTYTRFNDLKQAEAQAIRAEQDLIEIKAARKKAEDALVALKATQQQLIQAEKMASLGELTAGIAHEIQNPLNFVNNFSETNKELLEELKQELKNRNLEAVNTLASDVISNEAKINHHGKRAETIVKNMLQHSRTSKGEKQLIDINALTEEYLRLAYHGFRAKDKTFNITVETHFDESIGKINIVPQEIGRVLLNLFNNAFYATHEQLKKLGAAYAPAVSVRTKQLQDKIEISVQDNGMGISKSLQDKIFQPFFTTKPTGQGTGLGLSLSYDIVKAHNGELQVSSQVGRYTQFTLWLPLA